MNMDVLTPAWYVLHTRSRFENVVYEGLIKKSIDTFLPRVLVRSKRVDRKKLIRVPLFPGYVFVKTSLDPRQHLDILKTTGAVRLIGNHYGPLPVAEETISSLQIMVSGDNTLITGTLFTPGDRVMVISGPFAGVVGIFSRYGAQGRVIVNIEILGQFAAADVDEADIEILPKIVP